MARALHNPASAQSQRELVQGRNHVCRRPESCRPRCCGCLCRSTNTLPALQIPRRAFPFFLTSTQQAKATQATVEDLDLPPALSITPNTPIGTAQAMSYDRDYSQLTVVHPATRALLGYVAAAQLQRAVAGAAGAGDAPVSTVMSRFDRRRVKGYTLITPGTPLEDLQAFFADEEFAVVTDPDRRFVLGVATRADLDEFLRRRPD